MAGGTDKVAIQSGFDWKMAASELFSTGLEAGKQLLSAKLTTQVETSKQDTMAQAAQLEQASTVSKAKTIAFIAGAAVLAFIVFKAVKKQGVF